MGTERIDWFLDSEWRECSGGSRPGANLVRFIKLPEIDHRGGDSGIPVSPGRESSRKYGHSGVVIELSYVYDWDLPGREHIGFVIPAETFRTLVHQLAATGHASAAIKDDGQDFTFEWRLEGCELEFRVSGVPRYSATGPLSISHPLFSRIGRSVTARSYFAPLTILARSAR